MLLEILRDTSIQGRPAKAGAVLEVAERDARFLIAIRKARPAQEPPMAGEILEQPASPGPKAARTRKPRTP